jgi:MoxR-like ATPase
VPGWRTLTIKTTAAVLAARSRASVHADLVPPIWSALAFIEPAKAPSTPSSVRFSATLLADEINRAPAKVQSALLEVMQERQVTIGHDATRARSFLAMATQNPIESEGTTPCEAQVDRFMLKILSATRRTTGDDVQHFEDAPSCASRSLDDLRSPAPGVRHLRRSALISYSVTLADATEPRGPRPDDLNIHRLRLAARPDQPRPVGALALVRGRDYVVLMTCTHRRRCAPSPGHVPALARR